MKSTTEQSTIHQLNNLFVPNNGATTSTAAATSSQSLLIPPLKISTIKSHHNSVSDEPSNFEERRAYKQLSADEDEQLQQMASTSAPEDGDFAKVSRIRKRRYSQARIQPTRVKKVMQSDEDIGRMVASVPVAIGSAMEVFAEKLLLSAAECVQRSSTKTLSPMHIKMAVSRISHFTFLEPMLKEVQMHQQKSSSSHGQSSSSANGD